MPYAFACFHSLSDSTNTCCKKHENCNLGHARNMAPSNEESGGKKKRTDITVKRRNISVRKRATFRYDTHPLVILHACFHLSDVVYRKSLYGALLPLLRWWLVGRTLEARALLHCTADVAWRFCTFAPGYVMHSAPRTAEPATGLCCVICFDCFFYFVALLFFLACCILLYVRLKICLRVCVILCLRRTSATQET